jgi:5-methyltetrahydropteroyltriglutamate--homocysteine methyltransferase
MPDTIAPYRADEVGSLLRTAPLKEARAKREKSEITAARLAAVEDEEIRKITRKQEEVGLKLATDGEFRRSWWHFDFFGGLKGVEIYQAEQGIQFKGVQTSARAVRVTGKLDFPADHPMLEHFKFLKANTKATPKMTIPAPPVLHLRNGRNAVSSGIYPEMDAFFEDLGIVYGKAIKAFYEAGCRYLQLDDTTWGYLCSADEREKVRARGEDPGALPGIYARTINAALKSKPADMVVTTHVCRGNFRSRWISEGGYEPVAEQLLAGIDYDGYFLEYDTDRAGGLEPLRLQWASSPPRPATWRRRTTSSAASTRPPGTPRSTSSASPPSAASPPPRKAMSSPRMSSGPSSAWWWRSPARCGASSAPLAFSCMIVLARIIEGCGLVRGGWPPSPDRAAVRSEVARRERESPRGAF